MILFLSPFFQISVIFENKNNDFYLNVSILRNFNFSKDLHDILIYAQFNIQIYLTWC